jgi:hypothetical protein
MRFSRVFSIEIFFSQPVLPEISPSFILNEISALSQMRFLHGTDNHSSVIVKYLTIYTVEYLRV